MNPWDPPRCQHYTFAHAALRQCFFEDAMGVLMTLHSEQALPFLVALWEEVTRHCAAQGRDAGLVTDGLAVDIRDIGGCLCAIVCMPPPTQVVEAHFVGMTHALPSTLAEMRSDGATLRFFTLEKGGPVETVMCEWDVEGTHYNGGTGPAPTVDAFAGAISERLKRDSPARGSSSRFNGP